MACNRIHEFKGCGRCVLPLIDDTVIACLNPDSLLILLWKILTNRKFETMYMSENGLLYCDGTLDIDFIHGTAEYPYRYNRDVLLKMICTWLRVNDNGSTRKSMTMMKEISCSINKYTSSFKLSTYILSSIKTIRYLIHCNNTCDKIVRDKEVSNCTFRLGDHKTLSKVENPIVLIEVFLSVTKVALASTSTKECVDIDNIHIRCNGTVTSKVEFIHIEGRTNYILSRCREYLTSWIVRYSYLPLATTLQSNLFSLAKVNRLEDMYRILETCLLRCLSY